MITNNAKYTVLLSTLMESEQTKPLIDKALSTYPLYVGKKEYDLIPTRDELNRKILAHYKYREIGFETVGRFLFELEETMLLIMPYYNEIMKTIETMADLENPFDNVDFVETYEETRKSNDTSNGTVNGSQTMTNEASASSTTTTTGSQTSESESSSTTDNEEKKKFSDTPQNNVSNIDNYLSEYTVDTNAGAHEANESTTANSNASTTGSDESESTATATNETTTTGNSTNETTVSHTFTKKGNYGVTTFAHDILKYREQIVDVVNKIVTDKRINELFMLVW